MNDMNFLETVETIRQGLLYLLNSSLFWLFTGLWFMANTINLFKRSLRPKRGETEPKKPVKRWCYDE